MEVAGLRGCLRAGAADGYKQAHDHIPQDVLDAQRAAGVLRWLIFRDGLDLFHVAECEHFDEAMRRLAGDPVDQAWQRRMTPYKQPVSESGATERRIQLIYERDLWLP